MAATEQSMSVRQCIDAAVEHVEQLVRRPGALSRTLCNRRDACEHVLHAMVELGDQQVLVVLSISSVSHIDVDTGHPLGATRMIVGYEAARFYPPDLSARSYKAKLADEFGAPFLERSNVKGTQPLHVVSMDARVPLLSSEFHGALRQAMSRSTGA